MNINVDAQYSPVEAGTGVLESRPGRSSRTALVAVMAGILVVGIIAITISGSTDTAPSMPASQAPRKAAATQMWGWNSGVDHQAAADGCGDWTGHGDSTLYRDADGKLASSPWCQGRETAGKCIPGYNGAEKVRTMKCPFTCGYCDACAYGEDHNMEDTPEITIEGCASGPGALEFCKNKEWQLYNTDAVNDHDQPANRANYQSACPFMIDQWHRTSEGTDGRYIQAYDFTLCPRARTCVDGVTQPPEGSMIKQQYMDRFQIGRGRTCPLDCPCTGFRMEGCPAI